MKIDPPGHSRRQKFKLGFIHYLVFAAVLYLVYLIIFGSSNPLPLVFETGSGVKFYSKKDKKWTSPTYQDVIVFGEKIQVLPGGSAELHLGKAVIRLAGDTEVELKRGPLHNPGLERIGIEKGSLFVSTKNQSITVTASSSAETGIFRHIFYDTLLRMALQINDGVVLAGYTPASNQAWSKTLEGSARVRAILPWKWVEMKPLEKVDSLLNSFVFQPQPLNANEKLQLELLYKAASVPKQPIIPKKKTALVFGPPKKEAAPKAASPVPAVEKKTAKAPLPAETASSQPAELPVPVQAPQAAAAASDKLPTPSADSLLQSAKPFSTKSSSSTVEIKKDGAESYLEMAYDVSSPSSVAGINFSTEGIDFLPLTSLSFEARAGAEGGPTNFRIELKAGDQSLRAFNGKLTSQGAWEKINLPFKFTSAADITEISISLTNTKAGPSKKGSLQIKNLSLS